MSDYQRKVVNIGTTNFNGSLYLKGRLQHGTVWYNVLDAEGKEIMIYKNGVQKPQQKKKRAVHAPLLKKDGTLYGYEYVMTTSQKQKDNSYKYTNFILKVLDKKKITLLADELNAEVNVIFELPQNRELEYREYEAEINGKKVDVVDYTVPCSSFNVQRDWTKKEIDDLVKAANGNTEKVVATVSEPPAEFAPATEQRTSAADDDLPF